tara:strand:- start:327 stop:812 length:486 start_codon:yes stop_codon:yes gene_type:complete
MSRYAILLLVVGCLQMLGDVTGVAALKGIGAATAMSPAPRVFSSVKGLETYSTRFWIEWTGTTGESRSLELTPNAYARLRGPYNRRNVYGAALAYGPVLAGDPIAAPMLRSVLEYGLLGDAPILRELGLDPAEVQSIVLRLEPLEGTDLGDLPDRLQVPLR